MRKLLPSRVVCWAAQECMWQGSGEASVYRMIDAWSYAHRHRARSIGVKEVLELGRRVEPEANRMGIRHVRVAVGFEEKMLPEHIRTALRGLIDIQPDIPAGKADAGSWFKDFEDIHPFVDGNGRTGSILYNWLLGTLDKPIHPPNHWNESRRNYPAYPEPVL